MNRASRSDEAASKSRDGAEGCRTDKSVSQSATGEGSSQRASASQQERPRKKRLEIVRGRGSTYPASLRGVIGQEERSGAGLGFTRSDWLCRRRLQYQYGTQYYCSSRIIITGFTEYGVIINNTCLWRDMPDT